VTKFYQNDKIPLCCIVQVVYFVYAINDFILNLPC